MDRFPKRCQRCGGDTRNCTTMSMFSTKVICQDCKEKETKHPDYEKARQADIEASRQGDRNFAGIGEPSDL